MEAGCYGQEEKMGDEKDEATIQIQKRNRRNFDRVLYKDGKSDKIFLQENEITVCLGNVCRSLVESCGVDM